MPENLVIDKGKTALVVIDLQKGITAQPSRPFNAQEVIANAAKLVNAFRRNNILYFLCTLIQQRNKIRSTKLARH